MNYYGHDMGFFGIVGWIGLLVMILFAVILVILVIWAITSLLSPSRRTPPQSHTPHEDSAMRILRERYARGEIDTDQYEQARRTLEGGGGSAA